jgi:hypothetical protein
LTNDWKIDSCSEALGDLPSASSGIKPIRTPHVADVLGAVDGLSIARRRLSQQAAAFGPA